MPGKDGLLHISEIDWKRFDTMEETGIKEGDILTVKLLEIDKKTGKYRLSTKALKPKPEGYEERPERPARSERPERPFRDRGDRPERPFRDRGERGERPERGDRGDRHDDRRRF
jgi:polyribonucleotide nucleotidyltransferase